MSLTFHAEVCFERNTGIKSPMPLTLKLSNNYTIIVMAVNSILTNQGLAPISSPSIHVSYSDSSDIKELSGRNTLATIGFSENDKTKPKILKVYVNLPPAPEPDAAGCGCTIQ